MIDKDKEIFFEEIYKNYHSLIKGALFRMCAPSEIEDLIQDVYIKIWKSLHTIKKRHKIKSWIYRICYHQAIDFYRKRKPQSLEFSDHIQSEEIQNNENQKIILEGLSLLKPNHRIALVMHIMEGFSIEEISKLTHTPMGTIKSRLFHARQKMQNYLDKKEVLS